VVALEKDLVAAADAHHLMAEFVEARGRVASAGYGADDETEQAAVEKAAEELGWSRHHWVFRCSKFEEGVVVPPGLGS
jgi:hypothetical protein